MRGVLGCGAALLRCADLWPALLYGGASRQPRTSPACRRLARSSPSHAQSPQRGNSCSDSARCFICVACICTAAPRAQFVHPPKGTRRTKREFSRHRLGSRSSFLSLPPPPRPPFILKTGRAEPGLPDFVFSETYANWTRERERWRERWRGKMGGGQGRKQAGRTRGRFLKEPAEGRVAGSDPSAPLRER